MNKFICTLFLSFIVLTIPSKSQNLERINELVVQTKIIDTSPEKADLLIELSTLQEKYDLELAKEAAINSLSISKSIHYTEGIINAYHQMGKLERILGNYEEALSNHIKALKFSETLKDTKGVANTYLLIAAVFKDQEKIDLAKNYLNDAKKIGETTKDLAIQSDVNKVFGDISFHQGKHKLSVQYYQRSLDIIENSGYKTRIAIIHKSLGFVYEMINDNDLALEHYEKSMKIFEKLILEEEQAIINYRIGQIYQAMNDLPQAIVFFKRSLEKALEMGLEEHIKSGYQGLAESYEKAGDFKGAYEYLKYFLSVRDIKEVSTLESLLELEKKNGEIERINHEKEIQQEQLRTEKFYRTLGVFVLAVVVGLALFLLFSLRQRKKINKQLQMATHEANQSKQDKEDFFAYTSHEIRTPLNAVVGMTKILGGTNLNELQQKYVKTIAASAQNILFLVNDVLDLSKIEKGSLKLEEIDFSLHEIIEQIVQSLSFKKYEKDIEIIQEIDRALPQLIQGDPVRINQILLNLADNAVKFTDKGTVKIKVDILESNDEKLTLIFQIIDTGKGINPAKINTIFDSYKQENISTTRQFGGTGLGLSISKLLVEKMGGEIEVESDIGKGTKFSFILDFNKSKPDNTSRISSERVGKLKLRDLKILVVDDNKLNREIFFDLISDLKHNVSVDLAVDGEDAIEKFHQCDYDLILMDVQMPKMDGYDTTKYIRKKFPPHKKDIPVIAMTAHVLEGVIDKCLEAGMNDSIAKPINIYTLSSKIIECLPQKNIISSSFTNLSIPPKEKEQKEYDRINLSTLGELTGNNSKKINTYIDTINQNLPIDLGTLKSQCTGKEWTKMSKTAHKIKGSLLYVGNRTIMNEILLLEKASKENTELEQINHAMLKVENEIMLILEELELLAI